MPYNVVITNTFGVNENGAQGNDFITGSQGSCLTVWVRSINEENVMTAFAHILSANLVHNNAAAGVDITTQRLGGFWINVLNNWQNLTVHLISAPAATASTGFARTAIRNALQGNNNVNHIVDQNADDSQYTININGERTNLVHNGWGLTRNACVPNHVNAATFGGGAGGNVVQANNVLPNQQPGDGNISNILVNNAVPN